MNIPRKRRYPMRPISQASDFRHAVGRAFNVPPLLTGFDPCVPTASSAWLSWRASAIGPIVTYPPELGEQMRRIVEQMWRPTDTTTRSA